MAHVDLERLRDIWLYAGVGQDEDGVRVGREAEEGRLCVAISFKLNTTKGEKLHDFC